MFNSPSLVGLDIQPDEICLLQARRGKRKIQIEKYAFTELPVGAVVNGNINQFDTVCLAIKKLVRETGTAKCETAIALPSCCVMTKRIQLPAYLRNNECEAEIRENLPRYLPEIADDLCFDFVSVSEQAALQDILLVVARRRHLDLYATIVREAGLHVTRVDVDYYALLRALKCCTDLDFSSPHAAQVLRSAVSYGLAIRSVPRWWK